MTVAVRDAAEPALSTAGAARWTAAATPAPPAPAWEGVGLRLGRSLLLLPVRDVLSVLERPHLARVPGAPAWNAGVACSGGRITCVLDLRALLTGAPAREQAAGRVVVVARGAARVGLQVDAVAGRKRFSAGQRLRHGRVAAWLAPVVGMAYREGSTEWPVLDVGRLLARVRALQADGGAG